MNKPNDTTPPALPVWLQEAAPGAPSPPGEGELTPAERWEKFKRVQVLIRQYWRATAPGGALRIKPRGVYHTEF